MCSESTKMPWRHFLWLSVWYGINGIVRGHSCEKSGSGANDDFLYRGIRGDYGINGWDLVNIGSEHLGFILYGMN